MTSIESALSAPTGALGRAAAEFIAGTASPAIASHSHRSYHFGALASAGAGFACEPELAFVACMLHDVGLVPDYLDGKVRFEVAGANAARDWAAAQGLSDGDRERVWDAVALHTSPGIAEHKSGEARVVAWGAAADVFGLRISSLAAEQVRAVLDAHPRAGFDVAIRAALEGAVRSCPDAYTLTWLADTARERVGIPLLTGEQAFELGPAVAFADADR